MKLFELGQRLIDSGQQTQRDMVLLSEEYPVFGIDRWISLGGKVLEKAGLFIMDKSYPELQTVQEPQMPSNESQTGL